MKQLDLSTPESLGLPWADRILEYEDTGCWLWIGAVTRGGYGVVQYDGRQRTAHRAVYSFVHGDPGELVVDHLCRVHPCVNPAHLEAVTQKENVRRGQVSAVQRARHQKQAHCVNGHKYTSENTGYSTARGVRQRYCRICKKTTSRANYLKRRQREAA
ncbi:HNH endonuclease [Mycobacterium phage GageAP]|nr:HNH endonuclease [Mycobacterium phage GageAP]